MIESLLKVIVRILVIECNQDPCKPLRLFIQVLLVSEVYVLHGLKSRQIFRQILPKEVDMAQLLPHSLVIRVGHNVLLLGQNTVHEA